MEATYKLGICLAKQNKNLEAIDIFKKVIEGNSDYAPAHLELAKLLENKETPEVAESEYLLAIEKDSKLTEAYISLGRYYITLKKLDGAIEILNQPLMWLKPSNAEQAKVVAELRMSLGKAYFEKSDYEKAADQYNKVLMVKEYEEEAFIEVGRAYYRMNKDQQAIKAWQHALELNPENADIHFYLGSTFHKIGDLKKEVMEYQEAIRINPNHARAYANLGFAYFSQFKYVLAKEAWSKSIAIDSNQPHITKKLQEIDDLINKSSS
jgi:tetratricopeptide (TPR) repeat protein